MGNEVNVGDAVVFIDEKRQQHCALVTEVHGDPGSRPSVNLLWVSDDPNERDQYGRQINRDSSVVHRDATYEGNCWIELDL